MIIKKCISLDATLSDLFYGEWQLATLHETEVLPAVARLRWASDQKLQGEDGEENLESESDVRLEDDREDGSQYRVGFIASLWVPFCL